MAVVRDISYPSNNGTQTIAPKQEKVVSGVVKVKKPGLGRKFADAFLGAEVTDVRQYMKGIAIQAIKGMILDTIGMLFNGRPVGGVASIWNGAKVNVSPATNYSYGSFSRTTTTQQPIQTRIRPSYDNFVFSTPDDATNVLTAMLDLLERAGKVSLNDLYDMVGITAPWSDVYWGWTNLSTAVVSECRDGMNIGYMLVLPKPIRIAP